MGFELVQDTPMGPDAGSARWLEVRGPGGRVELVLFSPQFDERKIGQLAPVLFTCDDIGAAYAELSSRGA